MRKSKFTESQIVSILAQHEKGMKVADICREHGISQPTFYQWQRKYSGMSTNELRRLTELEAELSQFSLKINLAKTFEGFITRVMSKLAAFSILQRINIEKNRPLNQIKHAWRNRHNGLHKIKGPRYITSPSCVIDLFRSQCLTALRA
jgi:putative transposase